MSVLSTMGPTISREVLATGGSWWWVLELILVVVLVACSGVVLGLIIRNRRGCGDRPRGIGLLVVGVALMAGGGLVFMPVTASAESSWLTWFIAAAGFIGLVTVVGRASTPDNPNAGNPVFSRQHRDRMFHGFCLGVTGLSILALMVLLAAIGYLGWRYLSWDLLDSFASRKPENAGVKAALWGTIWICIVCALTAIPIGVATAIYLEEYSRKGRVHRIIDLNLSNLAGVPSIVYGIIGLTIFARMFGFFGPINDPAFQIGASHQASYLTASGSAISIPLDDPQSPPSPLRNGMAGVDGDGRPVTVTIVPDGTESDDPGAVWRSDAAEPSQVYEDRSWYYLQLPFGGTVLAGGFTLALVVLPIIIVASREAIRAVPASLREAALGCGATRWQMIRKVTLPAATPGIMTGSILAISRAMGEAAPLLVLTGILFIRFTPQHMMDDFTALPLQIYNWAQRPQEEFHAVAASGIVVLLALLLIFNAIAVVIRQCFQKPLQ